MKICQHTDIPGDFCGKEATHKLAGAVGKEHPMYLCAKHAEAYKREGLKVRRIN